MVDGLRLSWPVRDNGPDHGVVATALRAVMAVRDACGQGMSVS